MKEFSGSKVIFIAEQVGEPETRFKREISAFLRQFEEPLTAYLCRVAYGDNLTELGSFNVALCMSYKGEFKVNIIKGCSGVFYDTFGKHEHLDIIFLNEAQELDLKRVCSSFLVLT